MKFHFLGLLDCPEWLLAEVQLISRFSSIRLNLLCKQIIAALCGHTLNYDKIHKLTHSKRIQLTQPDVEALIAALTFIIHNSTKFAVSSTILSTELQQLGLPKDVVQAITQQYSSHQTQLKEYQSERVLSLAQVTDVKYRVDWLIASNAHPNVNAASVRLQLNTSKSSHNSHGSSNGNVYSDGVSKGMGEGSETVSFEMSAEKFRLFYSELKAAKQLMDSVNTNANQS